MNADDSYKSLADLLPQIVFEIDTSGLITYANREAFEKFGYTQKDFNAGLYGIEMFVPQDRERVEQAISRILQGEKLDAVEFTARRKNYTTFPALAYGMPRMDNGDIVGVNNTQLNLKY